MQSIVAPQSSKKTSGLAVTSIVLGSFGLVFAMIPFLNYVSGIVPFLGLIFGLFSLARRAYRKLPAIIGISISLLALVLTYYVSQSYTRAFANSVQKDNAASNSAVSVLYEVTGSSTDTTINYDDFSMKNISWGSERVADQKLPFSKIVTGREGWSSYNLYAMNYSDGGDLTCRITLNGVVVSEHTNSGQYASVSCDSGSTPVK